MPPEHDHAKRAADSQQLLQEAREKTRKQRDYDSEKTRQKLASLFEEQTGKQAHKWQIDVSEALICIIPYAPPGQSRPACNLYLPNSVHPETVQP
ncbi:hypothetical protein R3P38DRAFT_2516776 [Favolaschia claudopus]|uniref:Uncharacterized protein n=1 Tax=Favolaschia claudopus TaxID=2862362 RepID=A0AAW0CFU4_9AGAR